MSYTDIYVCGEFITRVKEGEKYIVVSNYEYYKDLNSIDSAMVIYDKAKTIYFDTLTVNNTLTIIGDLVIH